ncbi:hypothetical protein KPL70_004012 [Citrus sinensis]|nr:hypothetical protein KPL70_004012 [Citrus sinensis]
MRKYKSVDFQFDPEIERTARRLRREHRELQAAVVMDDLQDLRNLNRNNNIIHMANDRDRAIRDYAVLTPQAIHPGIVRPDVQADNFELKPVMFQMLQTVGQAAARGTTEVQNVDALTTLSAQVTLLKKMNQPAVAISGQNRPAQPPGFYPQNQEKISINNDQLSSLEGLIKDYIVKNEAVIQSHTVSLRNLENQIEQLAAALSNRPQAFAENDDSPPGGEEATSPTATELSRAKVKQSAQLAAAQPFRHPPPFPQKFQKQKQDKQFSKILGVLKQLHINISFMEALEQMPNYAKFFKDILTKKRRLGEFETVALTQECNQMLQSKIPQKMKDPGSFIIPCFIGTEYNGKALCDLRASINLMPLSVFKQLGVSECRPTTMTLQLADRSHAYPEGKIEDVLVKMDKFIFPVDFIVLDFEADKEVPIILGRPFLTTGKTLIDVQKRELTMRVNDQQVTFNVLDAMKSPDEIEDCNFISVVDFVVAERLHSCCSKEEINVATIEELDGEDHGAANIAWSGEKQPFRIDEQIQQREFTPYQQEFKVNGSKVKHYMRDDMNSLMRDRFLKDPG